MEGVVEALVYGLDWNDDVRVDPPCINVASRGASVDDGDEPVNGVREKDETDGAEVDGADNFKGAV